MNRRDIKYVTFRRNSHRHARPDKTVLYVSCLRRRCEFDSRQLKTVAGRKKWSLNTLIAILQFTPPCQTRHRQNCFVVSGGRCELSIRRTQLRAALVIALICIAGKCCQRNVKMPYRVSGSTLTAVGRSQLLARWPGTHSRILSGIPRAAQTVLGVYLKRTCSRDANASSALGGGFWTIMRYTNPRTHSLKPNRETLTV